MATTISLCCITGNEEASVLGFLNSFAPAFDELCLVRAIGANKPDDTLNLARRWCKEHGKQFRSAEYLNDRGDDFDLEADKLHPMSPRTWPHVDNFAAARNMAWRLARSDWQFWADLDDLLVKPEEGKPGGAELIRLCAEADSHDMFCFRYEFRTQAQANIRERLFRRGISRWVSPIHETCRCFDEDKGVRVCIEERVVFMHDPKAEKERDLFRNQRIIDYSLRYLDALAFEKHREHHFRWRAFRKPEEMELSTRWAEIAATTELTAAQRFDLCINQAEIAATKDPYHAIELAWKAIQIDPMQRQGWGDVARYYLMAGSGRAADTATRFMQNIPRPRSTGHPTSHLYHGWQGVILRVTALRAAGKHKLARDTEEFVFKQGGKRFSLLHATRGRPDRALTARDLWLASAFNVLGVEHIFAIDEDDEDSLKKLANTRHVVVPSGGGCVAAWNAAAKESDGDILVQLSDDWVPARDWDELLWKLFTDAAKARTPEGSEPIPVRDCPLVAAISDGHRKDALLCMAILTRARYLAQRDTPDGPAYLFAPQYKGVFSDNEFTVRAYDDGVVIDAKHITFRHDHPLLSKDVPWDQTYVTQNSEERYLQGRAVFNERNPKHKVPEKPLTSLSSP